MSNSTTVRETVWPWDEPPRGAAGDVSRRRRRKSVVQAVIMCVVAAVFAFFGKTHVAVIVGVLAAVVLASGLFFPRVFERIEGLGLWLGRVVGVSLTWILLVPFFYICFGIGRLVLLVTRKDPLTRAFPTDLPTYWIPRTPVPGRDHYRRQY